MAPEGRRHGAAPNPVARLHDGDRQPGCEATPGGADAGRAGADNDDVDLIGGGNEQGARDGRQHDRLREKG
jgi:hypothetical protein